MEVCVLVGDREAEQMGQRIVLGLGPERSWASGKKATRGIALYVQVVRSHPGSPFGQRLLDDGHLSPPAAAAPSGRGGTLISRSL
jgi:hypothetical protein